MRGESEGADGLLVYPDEVAVMADEDLAATAGEGLTGDPAAADVDLDRLRPRRVRPRGSGNRHGTSILNRDGSGFAASYSRFGVVMQIGHSRPPAETAVAGASNAGWLLNQRPPYNR